MKHKVSTLVLWLLVAFGLAACALAVGVARKSAPTVGPMPTVGQAAPAFTLPDQDGKTHSLKNYRGHVLVLAFYPADMTPGCTIEAHTMTGAYPSFQAAGIVPIGISVQDVKSHKEFCEKEGIPYTLLADSQKAVAARYGVLTDRFGGVANRVTFIVGKKGHVVYVDPNVNSHLTTCAQDWIAWVKANKAAVNSD